MLIHVSLKYGWKSFPNGLCGYKTAEKQHSWPSRLPGIASYLKLKEGVSHLYANKNYDFARKFLHKIML